MSDCKEWKGCRNKDGYGRITLSKIVHNVHRYAYCLHRGIPLLSIKGLTVCHSCDNRSCINPDHLFLGTQYDNVRDMISKGRRADYTGKNNPNYKHGKRALTCQI